MKISQKLFLFFFISSITAMDEKYYQFLNLNLALEQIGTPKYKLFSDFVSKKYDNSIVYASLCKHEFPVLNIIKVPIVSKDNPSEIRRNCYIVRTEIFEERVIKESGQEFLRLQESLIAQKITIKNQAEFYGKKFNELLEKEKFLSQKEEFLNQRENNITKREEEFQNDIKKTFWRRNPKYTFGMGVLMGGLLCGLGIYYGHAKIGSFIVDTASFFSRNK